MSFTIVSIASWPKSLLAAARQRVRLVDQQHAPSGPVEHLRDLQRRLADVAGDQAGPVGLDQVALLDDPERPVDLGEQAGDGGLAGARVAGEDEVAALLDHRQAALACAASAPAAGW